MTAVILVIHLFIAIAMVTLVLLQRSEGGALSGLGGGGAGGGLVSGRAAGNILTRSTAILAALFMVTSLTLAIIANQGRDTKSIMEDAPAAEDTVPAAPVEPMAPVAGDEAPASVPAPEAPAGVPVPETSSEAPAAPTAQ